MTNNTVINPKNKKYFFTFFNSLSIVESGIVLKNKNKEEYPVLFSELEKIYIKRCKLTFLFKTGFLILSTALIPILSPYFSLEVLFFAIFLFFIPLYIKMYSIKWYQLQILLNDGTFYKFYFFSKTKQEYIIMVNLVRKEMFNYQIKKDIQYEYDSLSKIENEEEIKPFLDLSIA